MCSQNQRAKLIFCFIACVQFFCSHATAANKFDSSILKTEPLPAAPQSKPQEAPGKPNKSTFKPQTTDVTDEKIAIERIRAVNTLITKEKNPVRKRKLLFNKGILYLQYARLLRLKAKSSAQMSVEESNALKNTFSDMDEIMKDPNVNKEDQAYANYIAGMALSSLGKEASSIGYLIRSIELNPSASFAVGVSLFLGEHFFDHEKYKDAVSFYKRFYVRMGVKEKALAKYKTAWSYWNLKEIEKAQKYFIELAKDRGAGEFSVDANKDLAYVMTQNKTEDEILSYSESIFGPDSERRIIFLTSSYLTLRRQRHSIGVQKIFQSLLTLEKRPSKKITLWLDELRNNKFEYASQGQFDIFAKMTAMFNSMGSSDKMEVYKNVGDDFENETQSLIRSFVDTYAGRIKNIENIDKKKLSLMLQTLFKFHDDHFQKSKVRVAINQLWLDICVDQKDLKCVYDISNKILNDPALSVAHERANVELLTAVDELFKQDENKYRADYVSILEKYVKNDKAPRWLDASKRLSAIYLSVGQYEKAIPLLVAINEKEKTPESYYRLQLGRYDAKKYKDVVESVPPSGVKPTEKTVELLREASLKLALEYQKDTSQFAQYETNIERFLALNSDEAKATIALKEFLNLLVERKDYQRASERLVKVNPALRRNPDLKSIEKVLIVQALKVGQFERARSLLPTNPTDQNELKYERYTVHLGLSKDIKTSEIAGFDKDKKQYFLGLLALTAPHVFIGYIENQKALTPELKKLTVLALQIIQGQKYIETNKTLKLLLGAEIPTPPSVPIRIVSERMILNTKLPKALDTSAESAQNLERLMKRVRKVRAEVVKELPQQLSDVQVRVLVAASKLESDLGQLILNSPIPEGFTPEQQTQYKTGLQDLAKEFVDQAAEFEKTRVVLVNKKQDEEKATAELVMPPFDSQKWKWPSIEHKDVLLQLCKAGRFTGAILSLDLQHSAKEVSDKDYYAMRAGILNLAFGNAIMADYVRRELADAHQDELISEWKAMK